MARQNTVEVVIKAQDEASKTLQSLGDAVKTIGLTALAKEVIEAGIELAQLGSQAIAVEQRFVAFAGSNEEAARTLELVSRATQGTLSDMDAMQGATKLFQMGLAGSAEEAANLIGIATKLGDQTMSVSDRVADFAALLANQSTPRLDNFGISSGKVKERIAELQAETPGLSRETAFMTATLEEAGVSMETLGTAGLDAQSGTASLSAEFDNFKVAAGKRLAPALQDVSGWLGDLLSNVNQTSEDMDNAGMSVSGLVGNMTLWLDVIGITTPALAAAREELDAMTASVGASGDRYAAMATAYEADSQAIAESSEAASRSASAAADRYTASAQAFEDASRAAREASLQSEIQFKNTAAALSDLTAEQLVSAQLQALEASREEGTITTEQYLAAQDALLKQFGLLTPAEEAAHIEMNRLRESFEAGRLSAEAYALRIDETRQKMVIDDTIAQNEESLIALQAAYDAGKLTAEQYTEESTKLHDALGELRNAFHAAKVEIQEMPESAGGGIDTEEIYTRGAAAAEEYQVSHSSLVEQIAAGSEEMSEYLSTHLMPAQEKVEIATRNLSLAFDEGRHGLETYSSSTEETREKLIVEQDIENSKAAIDSLSNQFELGKVPLDEYTRATEDLRAEIAALEDKTVTISVYYEYPNGKDPDVPNDDLFSPTLPTPGGDFDFTPVTPDTFTPMSPTLPGGSTTNNNFNMTINTRATQSNVLSDIRTMQALYGVR